MEYAEQLSREIKLFQELKHDHLIVLLDVFGHGSNVLACIGIWLHDTYLEQKIKDKSVVFTPGTIKVYILMALQGLEYLHLLWILHRVNS